MQPRAPSNKPNKPQQQAQSDVVEVEELDEAPEDKAAVVKKSVTRAVSTTRNDRSKTRQHESASELEEVEHEVTASTPEDAPDFQWEPGLSSGVMAAGEPDDELEAEATAEDEEEDTAEDADEASVEQMEELEDESEKHKHKKTHAAVAAISKKPSLYAPSKAPQHAAIVISPLLTPVREAVLKKLDTYCQSKWSTSSDRMKLIYNLVHAQLTLPIIYRILRKMRYPAVKDNLVDLLIPADSILRRQRGQGVRASLYADNFDPTLNECLNIFRTMGTMAYKKGNDELVKIITELPLPTERNTKLDKVRSGRDSP